VVHSSTILKGYIMSSTSTSNEFDLNDFALGANAMGTALQILGHGVAIAIAFSSSTVLMGIIMYITMCIVMALLMALVHMLLLWKLPADTTASIGRFVGSTGARITSLFSRKVAA